MRDKPFMCGACHKRFQTHMAVQQHAEMVHPKHGRVWIYKQVGSVICSPPDDEPSFADRAVAAQLAVAMGEPTDDLWLIGEG